MCVGGRKGMKAVCRYLFIPADVTIWERGKRYKSRLEKWRHFLFYVGCGIVFQVLAERICST